MEENSSHQLFTLLENSREKRKQLSKVLTARRETNQNAGSLKIRHMLDTKAKPTKTLHGSQQSSKSSTRDHQ